MAAIDVLIATAITGKLNRQAERGNLRALGKALDNTNTSLGRLESAINNSAPAVKIGSTTGNGSSLNVSVGFAPEAVFLARANGTAVYLNFSGVGDGKALYIRGDASAPESMGVIASLGIYLQSGGFSLGSTLSVDSKSLVYMAVRSGLHT